MENKDYEFGRGLSKILEEKGMVAADLAKTTGISKSYLSRVLRDENVPSLGVLEKIAKALGVSLNYVLLRSANLENMQKGDTKMAKLMAELLPLIEELDELIYPDRGNALKRVPVSPKKPVLVS